ncbi:MAG: HAMP domain-containing histidine kinase [Rickettsiales bacterium]|nr:HAMP domain-containing histidine kinase [Rickettsiales bacterium]
MNISSLKNNVIKHIIVVLNFLKIITGKIKPLRRFIRKKLLPKTLFFRMLLIIIVPTLIAQIISTYIFYNKHWDNLRKYIIYNLSNEISLVVNTYKSLPKTKLPKINKYTFLRYNFSPKNEIIKLKSYHKLPKEIKILQTNIEYNLPNKTIDVAYNRKTKEVQINIGQISGGTLSFHINHKKLFIKSTYTFIIWMIGSSLTLLIITLLFAKNQIRSITRLSKVAHKLSKGQSVKRFIPHGASEVRNAGHAFLKMKQTIEEEVKKKSEMLAWVSHDLRTPLTRMKLQLAMIQKTEQTTMLQQDVHQMEKIINDYLNFAKGDTAFKVKNTNLSQLFKEITKTAKIGTNCIFETHIEDKIYAKINDNQLKRALFNLIDNAKRFGSKIIIKLYKNQNKSIVIEIHDNGSGIAESEIKNVFKPFYRGDNYKNQRANGVGLGIPIAATIIKNHNGLIKFTNSPLGGVMITILLDVQAVEPTLL